MYLNHPKFEQAHYEHLRDDKKFKTGDMILFHALDNINPIMMGSYYGHVGIVYVDPDDPEQIPYLFEAAGVRNIAILDRHNDKGIFLTPLDKRLRKYRGYIFYKELSGTLDKHIVRDFKKFIEYAHNNMFYEYDVIDSGLKKGFGQRLGNNTNCAEITYLSLIKLGMLSLDRYENSIFHYLRWVCGLKKLDNAMVYHDPVYVVDHPF